MSTLKVTNITPQSGTDVYLTGSLIISNVLRAREVVTTISSSQILVSGSTNFGDTNDDTHTFTGSINITGSVSADDYTGIFNGALSGSAQIADDISGSFGAASASFSTRLTTEESNVDALQTDSASFSTRLTTAESELGNTLLSSSAQIASDISGSFVAASSSIAVDIDALQLFSTSLDATYATDAQLATATASLSSSLATDIATRALTANISGSFTSTSASIATDIASLTSATSSYALGADLSTLDGIVNSIKEVTGSYATTGSNTFTDNQIVSASVLLTLQQLTGSMPTGVATGSLIVSGSPAQLYIYNGSGSGWNRV